MTELTAWIVFPLIALAVCTGIGLLAERLARAELEPVVVPALGFATAIAALGPLFTTGLGGLWGAVLLAALATAGFVVGDARRLRPSLGAATGGAIYALHMAPIALTGTATFLGYNLLNDTAIHLALVDWIGDHGSRYLAEPPSSYAATMTMYVSNGYPLGSHELLAALKPFVGLDPATVYQPFLAVTAAIAAAAIYGLIRPDPRRADVPPIPAVAAAATAFAALASQLVFSFALQGSIKELAFIACLAAAAGAARHPVLLALPAAALFSIYGLASIAWIAPLALLALALIRPGRRTALVAAAVFLVAIAVYVPDAVDFYKHGRETLTSGDELGPLAGPLKFVQVAGVWLNGDYRFTPNHSWITYVLAATTLGLGVAGLVAAIRGGYQRFLLFAVPATLAFAVVAPVSSPYIDAKLLAILSPAVVTAAGISLASIRIRPLALATAGVLALALLVSDALAYRMALPAPASRLDELAQIDKRFAGRGPVLVNEFEEYVKHYMRRSRGSEPYEAWTAGRAQLRNPKLPVTAHRYDLDQMTSSFVQRWPLIVLRKSPVGSRPPSNYKLVFQTSHYEAWRREGPAPLMHIPLGSPPFDPTGLLDCGLVRRLTGTGTVVAAIRPRPVVVPLPQAPLPPGWYRYGNDRRMLEIHKGGRLTIPAKPLAPVQLWLRGRTARVERLTGLAVPRSLQRISEWIELGRGALNYQMPLVRPKRSLRPGDAQPDVVGPLAAVLERTPTLARGRQVTSACNSRADWIDVVRR